MIKELIKTEFVCEYLLNEYNNLEEGEYLCAAFTTNRETPVTGLYKFQILRSSKQNSKYDFSLANSYFDRDFLLSFFKQNNMNFFEELITLDQVEEQLKHLDEERTIKAAYDIDKTSYLYLGQNLKKDQIRKLIV